MFFSFLFFFFSFLFVGAFLLTLSLTELVVVSRPGSNTSASAPVRSRCCANSASITSRAASRVKTCPRASRTTTTDASRLQRSVVWVLFCGSVSIPVTSAGRLASLGFLRVYSSLLLVLRCLHLGTRVGLDRRAGCFGSTRAIKVSSAVWCNVPPLVYYTSRGNPEYTSFINSHGFWIRKRSLEANLTSLTHGHENRRNNLHRSTERNSSNKLILSGSTILSARKKKASLPKHAKTSLIAKQKVATLIKAFFHPSHLIVQKDVRSRSSILEMKKTKPQNHQIPAHT